MEGRRAVDLRNFGLVGIVPDQVLDVVRLFERADRATLSDVLRDRAGYPWARAFEDAWSQDEAEARRRGLFDLVWHRRALQVDPMVQAPAYAGFDVLLDVVGDEAPEVHALLSHLNPVDPDNERRRHGPDWWRAWHDAAATRAGGWLGLDEVRRLADSWSVLTSSEIEETCLTLLGATFTHPGCWKLLTDLGGFFAQCATEKRVVVAEVDP